MSVMESPDLRWSTRRRLEFIEFRLYWEGSIRRSHLMERFDISMPQASADIGRYLEIAEENAEYDSSLKAYVARPGFEPRFYEPSASEYLAELRAIADKSSDPKKTWISVLPEFEAVPLVRRRLDPGKLRLILRTIRQKQAINVSYQSLNDDEPQLRWIEPYALGFDGSRWHLRAWCHKRRAYRDFVLARILEVRGNKPRERQPDDDIEWNTIVTLIIGPHSKLGDRQRRVIELDYGMKNGQLKVQTRLSLLFYLEKALLIDEEASQALPPKRLQVMLLNRKELTEEKKRVAEQVKSDRQSPRQ
jgi:predicted DNA-binding transcriptional regulator YafY